MFFVHINTSGLQASVLLGLRRLLVHNFAMGCCAQTRCPELFVPPAPFPAPSAQRRPARSSSRLWPGCAARLAPGVPAVVFWRGSTPGTVPSLCAWPRTLDFIIPAARCLDSQGAIADGTCPEILLWKHAREIFAETIAPLCKVAPTLFIRVCFLRERPLV